MRSGTANTPLLLVSDGRTSCMASLITLIDAPCTVAPVGSVTVPDMVAVTCACAFGPAIISKAITDNPKVVVRAYLLRLVKTAWLTCMMASPEDINRSEEHTSELQSLRHLV